MMKPSIKITLTKYNFYWHRVSNTPEMDILGDFLIDIGCNFTVDQGVDGPYDMWGGNVTWLEKEDDYIIMTDQYAEPEFEHVQLRITKDEFINLVSEWKKVCKLRPKEITITPVGEKFIFTY